VPLLPAIERGADARIDDGVLAAAWRGGDRRLQLIANLSDAAKPRPALIWGQPIWGNTPPQHLPPWSVYAAIGGA
jgi:hypothetical protein